MPSTPTQVVPDLGEIARFYTLLYASIDTGWMVLTTPAQHGSSVRMVNQWHDLACVELSAIAEYTALHALHNTVYHGCVIQSPVCTPDPGKRGTRQTAYALPGLWCDLDLAYGQHAQAALPQTDAELLAMLHRLPFPPSCIIHSGGGMYAWWCFKEPLYITNDAERDAAEMLSKRFGATMLAIGRQHGWQFDSTADLARILRPAGSVNTKYGKRVTVIDESGVRYDPCDFDQWLLPLPSALPPQHGGLTGQPSLLMILQHYVPQLTYQTHNQEEYQGSHPVHGSTGGMNFNFNVAKGLWHCWRCNTGGDALTLIALCEGILACAACSGAPLQGSVFQQVLTISDRTFGTQFRGRPAFVSMGVSPNGQTSTLPGSFPQAPLPLRCTKSGIPYPDAGNLRLIFTAHEAWKDRLWWDVFRGVPMCDTAPFDDALIRHTAAWLGDTFGMSLRSTSLLREMMEAVAAAIPRDPLQEFLAGLPPWDGVSRLGTWASDYCGAEESAYTQFVSTMLWVSLVARAMHPGCIARYVFIFHGDQNIGKSKLIQGIGQEYAIEITGGLDTKDFYYLLQGAWVAEICELQGFSRTEETRIKAIMSQVKDSWIPKYSNYRKDVPRRTIFIGTTNEQEFLRDHTGNTRYLALHLGATGDIDVAAVHGARTMLLAEALTYWRTHPDTWWEPWDPALDAQLTEEQECVRAPTAWEDALPGWLRTHGYTEISWHTLAEEFLQLPIAQWADRGVQTRMGHTMRALGWNKFRYRSGPQKGLRVWRRP